MGLTGYLSLIFLSIGFFLHTRGIWAKKIIPPNKTSFFIFFMVSLAMTLSVCFSHADIAVKLVMIVNLFWQTFRTSVVFVKGVWKPITKGEKLSLFFSLASLGILAYLYFTHQGAIIVSMILALFPSLLGFIFIVISAYKFPNNDHPLPWLALTLAYLMTLFGVRSYSLETLLFPVAFFFSSIIVFLLLMRRYQILNIKTN